MRLLVYLTLILAVGCQKRSANHGLSSDEMARDIQTIESALALADQPAQSTLPGDCDGDNDVDGADFLAWQRTVNTPLSEATEAYCDFDHDNDVDGDDLAIWQANFGQVGVPADPFDIIAPTGTVLDQTVTVSWQASSGETGYEVRISADTADDNCLPAVATTAVASGATSAQLGPLSSGSYKTCVFAASATGQVTKASNAPLAFSIASDFHRIFVTSTTHGITTSVQVPPFFFPNFGGLDAADWVCTNAASAAGLFAGWNGIELVYKAVLSNSTTNAIDRLAISGPLFLVDDTLVAHSQADFFDGQLEHAINLDQNGQSQSGAVWTGTGSSGIRTANTCGLNWNNNSGGVTGTAGSSTSTLSPFSGEGTRECNTVARLYCVSPTVTQ